MAASESIERKSILLAEAGMWPPAMPAAAAAGPTMRGAECEVVNPSGLAWFQHRFLSEEAHAQAERAAGRNACKAPGANLAARLSRRPARTKTSPL